MKIYNSTFFLFLAIAGCHQHVAATSGEEEDGANKQQRKKRQNRELLPRRQQGAGFDYNDKNSYYMEKPTSPFGDHDTNDPSSASFIDSRNLNTDQAFQFSSSAHACLLAYDIVQCVGYNYYGQLGQSSSDAFGTPVPLNFPNTSAKPIKVVTGYDHTCILFNDKYVWCNGSNGFGQLGNGGTVNSATPVQVKKNNVVLTNVIDIEAGPYHNCAIQDSGVMYCWGFDADGQLGMNSIMDGSTNEKKASKMALAMSSTCIVNVSDATSVACIGYGYGDVNTSSTISLGSNINKMTAGSHHFCALLVGGTAKCWGANNAGQLGIGSTDFNPRYDTSEDVLASSGITILSSIADINAGNMSTCLVLSNGSPMCFGNNQYFQLGIANGGANVLYPTLVTPIDNITGKTLLSMHVGEYTGHAVFDDDSVYSIGSNNGGTFGDGSTISSRNVIGDNSGASALQMKFIIGSSSPSLIPSSSPSLSPSLGPSSNPSQDPYLLGSKGWRLWADNSHTTSGWAWDISLIQFYTSVDCSGSAIANDGTPIHSGSYDLQSWGPQNAFQNSGAWGGRTDENGEFYIGMVFSTTKDIKCIKFKHDGDKLANEVRVQAQNASTGEWENVHIAKDLGFENVVKLSPPIDGYSVWLDGYSWKSANNVWENLGSAQFSDPVLAGTFNAETWNGGFNADAGMKYIYGGTTATVAIEANQGWPSGADYTFFHVTRYNGSAKNQIWKGIGMNWVSGHWNNDRAHFNHNEGLGFSSGFGRSTDWGLYTDIRNRVRVDGVTLNKVSGNPGSPPGIGINPDQSDWASALVLVYPRALSDPEVYQVESWIINKYGASTNLYHAGLPKSNSCPPGHTKVVTMAECYSSQVAAQGLNSSNHPSQCTNDRTDRPSGCYYNIGAFELCFNNNIAPVANTFPENMRSLCKRVPCEPDKKVNVALSGTATQSSIAWGGSPSRAIDGNTSGDYWDNSTTHTNDETDPWWKVQLSQEFSISKVIVYNRDAPYSDRLNNFRMTVLRNGVEVFRYDDTASVANLVTSIVVPSNVIGDAVQIQLFGTEPNKVVSLAEVEVEVCTINVAYMSGTATQSSTGWGGSPSRAIDGNTSGIWDDGSITHTNEQTDPWWKVQLSQEYSISKVIVYNREDGPYSTRLNNFRMTVLRNGVEVFRYDDTASVANMVTSIVVPSNVIGDAVQIQLFGTNRALNLAEVEVEVPV